MNLGEVLTRSWQIIWKHKVLWIFGILAGCSGGGGGGGGNGMRYSQNSQQLPPQVQQFAQWINDNPWIIAVFIALFCVLILVSLLLGTIGTIGLIKGAQKADGGAEKLGFGELWSESLPYFGRVFGLWLLLFMAGLVIGVIVVVVVVFLGVATLGIGLICLIPLICLLVPLIWAVGVVVEQGVVAMIVEDRSLTEGLRRGWEVVSANVGQYVLMALILLLGGAIAGFVVALPIFVIVFPAVIVMASGQDQSSTPLMIAGLCFVLYLPVLLVLNGILHSYIQSAWTLTFLRLTGRAPTAPAAQVEVVHA